jgi:hypothetical protein
VSILSATPRPGPPPSLGTEEDDGVQSLLVEYADNKAIQPKVWVPCSKDQVLLHLPSAKIDPIGLPVSRTLLLSVSLQEGRPAQTA